MDLSFQEKKTVCKSVSRFLRYEAKCNPEEKTCFFLYQNNFKNIVRKEMQISIKALIQMFWLFSYCYHICNLRYFFIRRPLHAQFGRVLHSDLHTKFVSIAPISLFSQTLVRDLVITQLSNRLYIWCVTWY